MALEEQFHQAFSQIITANQQENDLVFEGNSYGPSRGPKNHNGIFDLSGSCGLLGYAHPLFIKSYMKLSLIGTPFFGNEEKPKLVSQINEYLSQLVETGVSLVNAIGSHEVGLGRGCSFLHSEAQSSLDKGDPISLRNLSGSNLSFAKNDSKIEKLNDHSFSELFLLKELLKYLSIGQFYGETGLIKKREQLLKLHFNFAHSIDGLIVELKSDVSSKKIITKKRHLIFPLGFDEEMLVEIKKLLGES